MFANNSTSSLLPHWSRFQQGESGGPSPGLRGRPGRHRRTLGSTERLRTSPMACSSSGPRSTPDQARGAWREAFKLRARAVGSSPPHKIPRHRILQVSSGSWALGRTIGDKVDSRGCWKGRLSESGGGRTIGHDVGARSGTGNCT